MQSLKRYAQSASEGQIFSLQIVSKLVKRMSSIACFFFVMFIKHYIGTNSIYPDGPMFMTVTSAKWYVLWEHIERCW